MSSPLLRHLAAVASMLAAISLHAEAVFIAHPDTAAASLSKDQLKSILLGTQTKWDGGGVIKLAVLAEGPTHESVISTFTGRTADQFDKYWKKQVFTGKGIMPDQFKTDADIVAFVARTPGAFGYADSAAATGVKVIAVQ